MAATAHALHILVKHKEIAEDIIKQLGKGAKFQSLIFLLQPKASSVMSICSTWKSITVISHKGII